MSREGNQFMVDYLLLVVNNMKHKLESLKSIIDDNRTTQGIQDSCTDLLFDLMHDFEQVPDEEHVAFMEDLDRRTKYYANTD